MRAACVSAILIALGSAVASDNAADLPRRAVEQSQITLAGSPPFHLKAKVVEATNPDNDGYKAEIEEYWAAPDKFHRTIKSRDLSETLIVNGGQISDQITGD